MLLPIVPYYGVFNERGGDSMRPLPKYFGHLLKLELEQMPTATAAALVDINKPKPPNDDEKSPKLPSL